MPPCFDVYVWVRTPDKAAVLSSFVDRYVDATDPGDPRYEAFVRTLIEGQPAAGDRAALADLRRDTDASVAFSIYLHARAHHEAIVTLTEEGDLVLGLGLDDPLNDPRMTGHAAQLMANLKSEFQAVAGVAGVELPPPQTASEWADDGLVILRDGQL